MVTSMNLIFSQRLAIAIGVALPLAETLREGTGFTAGELL